jgi:ribonuclease HI
MISLVVDGACSGNPGPGGWGAIIVQNKEIIKELSGFSPSTTNNRMELQAAIEGIQFTKTLSKNFLLITDSIYVKDGITKWIYSWQKTNWNAGKIKNIELWQTLNSLNRQATITWEWVKGHSGHLYNERADFLAREEIKKNT